MDRLLYTRIEFKDYTVDLYTGTADPNSWEIISENQTHWARLNDGEWVTANHVQIRSNASSKLALQRIMYAE